MANDNDKTRPRPVLILRRFRSPHHIPRLRLELSATEIAQVPRRVFTPGVTRLSDAQIVRLRLVEGRDYERVAPAKNAGQAAAKAEAGRERIAPTHRPWNEHTVDELKAHLESRDLPVSGRKDELIERLEADDQDRADEGTVARGGIEELETDRAVHREDVTEK